MIREDEFLEYAEVFGNYYGTAKRFLREAVARGQRLLLDIDVQGAAQVKRKVPDAVSIFILPPSREELERRLRRRSEADDESADASCWAMARACSIPRRSSSAACRPRRARLRISASTTIFWSTTGWSESIDTLKSIVEAERLKRSARCSDSEGRSGAGRRRSCPARST